MTRSLTMLNESGDTSITAARNAARLRGEKSFCVKTPCANGHFAERMVSTGRCVNCRDTDNRTAYLSHQEDRIKYAREKRARSRGVQQDQHVHVWSVYKRKTGPLWTVAIVDRSTAKRDGAIRFFTGKPCRNGHLSERITSTGKCLVCHKDRVARQRRRNPERNLQKARTYWKNNRKKILANAARRRRENPSVTAAASHRWRARNYEKWLESMRSYYAKNIDKERVRSRKKSSRRRSAEGSFAASDIDRLWILQKGKCALCGIKLSLKNRRLDHIQPLARGGTNWPKNLQWLCHPCNQRKHATDPLVHARKMGLLL